MGLTSAMFRVCPGVPKSITLCAAEGVAILVLSQTLRRKKMKKTYEDHDANADNRVSCQPIG